MAINNFDSRRQRIQREADRNYVQFDRHLSTFMDFGSNDKMLTNIHDMKNKIEVLVEEGQIRDGDFNYSQLKGILDGAISLQQVPKKSLEDISLFYSAYNNFNDVYQYISGDK